MSLLQLDPKASFERWQSAGPSQRVLSFWQSTLIGCGAFTGLSLGVFATWAFGGRFLYGNLGNLGELGAYGVWCLLFLLGAGLLRPALTGPISWGRFYGMFLASFFSYAVVWTIAWMVFHNWVGEWLGALFGMVSMAGVLCWIFGAMSAFPRASLVLFVGNAVGYFLGSWLHANSPAPWAQLLWGLCYGGGTGLGMGMAFHFCQAPLRALIAKNGSSSE